MKHKASRSGTAQSYETKKARGTARPISLSLDAGWLARLDALCQRRAVTRSELVRWLIELGEASEGGKSAQKSASPGDE